MQRELKSIGSVHDELLLNRNSKNAINSIQFLNHQQSKNNELLEKSNKELEGLAKQISVYTSIKPMSMMAIKQIPAPIHRQVRIKSQKNSRNIVSQPSSENQ